MSDGCVRNCPSSTREDGGRWGGGVGGRGDECIGKGKGSFALSLGGGDAYHLHKPPIKFDVLRERPAIQRIQISFLD